jgi:hypothetical protein
MKGMEGRPTLIKPQGDRGERLGQRLVAPRTAGAAPGRPQLWEHDISALNTPELVEDRARALPQARAPLPLLDVGRTKKR